MKVDFDPRLPNGGDLQQLKTRLYDVLRMLATAVNRHEGGYVAGVVSTTASYTVQADDGVIFVDATAGARTVTLQQPAESQGKRVSVRKTDASANDVTVQGPSGLIDGAATLVLTAAAPKCTLASNGTNHFTI